MTLKRIVLILTGIMLIGLSALLVVVHREEQAQVSKYEEMNEKRRPLLVKKAEIERKLTTLAGDYDVAIKHRGTTQVLFTDLDEQIYTVAYPVMKEFEFKGILGLSPTRLPGMEGCLSVDQFKELIEEGWTSCIVWDDSTDMKKWSTQLKKRLQEMDAELGQAVYFPQGTYKAALDAQVKAMGCSIAVYNEGEGSPLIQLEEEEGIWHLGAIGFMSEIPKVRLTEAVAQQGNITYLVGFTLQHEKYQQSSFTSMLGYFESYEANAELKVGSFEETRAHYRGRTEGVDTTVKAEYEAAKEPLEAELAAIEAELEALGAN